MHFKQLLYVTANSILGAAEDQQQKEGERKQMNLNVFLLQAAKGLHNYLCARGCPSHPRGHTSFFKASCCSGTMQTMHDHLLPKNPFLMLYAFESVGCAFTNFYYSLYSYCCFFSLLLSYGLQPCVVLQMSLHEKKITVFAQNHRFDVWRIFYFSCWDSFSAPHFFS